MEYCWARQEADKTWAQSMGIRTLAHRVTTS